MQSSLLYEWRRKNSCIMKKDAAASTLSLALTPSHLHSLAVCRYNYLPSSSHHLFVLLCCVISLFCSLHSSAAPHLYCIFLITPFVSLFLPFHCLSLPFSPSSPLLLSSCSLFIHSCLCSTSAPVALESVEISASLLVSL